MELTLARRALMLSIVMLVGLASLIAGNISGQNLSPVGHFPAGLYRDHVENMQSFKASFSDSLYHDRGRRSLPPTSDSPSPGLAPSPPPLVNQSPRLYHVTSYGPDPTGKTEGPDALFNAITNAFNQGLSDGFLMKGIANLGGAEANFEEGTYSINRPLRVPTAGRGNFRENPSSRRVYHVTSYGADPTGKTDSTDALIGALSDAFNQELSDGFLMNGIVNLGGAEIDLEGGTYSISRPLRLPISGRGNFKIQGGTLKASDNFPADGYLIDISSAPAHDKEYDFEYITLRDLMLDSNFTGGGIQVINSLRTTIDNCYIAHFNTNGILVQGGHETYIRNSFLGQHITAGSDPGERNFSGTGINLMSNDNAITDVVIFSAGIGIMISGQANTLSGVHCYNKATGFGGTGIYLKLPGLTQTRIVNCYLDYTGIVAEDPVQLHISSSFFLGDAFILLKSIHGAVNGVSIVDNMFSGFGKGIEIVQLDQSNGPFRKVDQVVVDRNVVNGMNIKSTIAKGSVQGNGSSWTVDFSPTLLFPNLIKNVQYSLSTPGSSFPNHALRNTSNNRVVIETDVAVPAKLLIIVDQGV